MKIFYIGFCFNLATAVISFRFSVRDNECAKSPTDGLERLLRSFCAGAFLAGARVLERGQAEDECAGEDAVPVVRGEVCDSVVR